MRTELRCEEDKVLCGQSYGVRRTRHSADSVTV